MTKAVEAGAPAPAPEVVPITRRRRLLVATKIVKRDPPDLPILPGTLIDASAEEADRVDAHSRVATKTDEALAGPLRVRLG
jgi:hypothetical protein